MKVNKAIRQLDIFSILVVILFYFFTCLTVLARNGVLYHVVIIGIVLTIMWIKIVWPNFTIQALQGALLSCTYTMLDYAQTGLIAAVFFFKVSEALCTNDVNTLSIVLKKMIMLYYVPKPVCNVIKELNWFHKILLLVLGHIFMFMHFDMSYNHGRILFLLFNMFCRSSFPLTCYWFELLRWWSGGTNLLRKECQLQLYTPHHLPLHLQRWVISLICFQSISFPP